MLTTHVDHVYSLYVSTNVKQDSSAMLLTENEEEVKMRAIIPIMFNTLSLALALFVVYGRGGK